MQGCSRLLGIVQFAVGTAGYVSWSMTLTLLTLSQGGVWAEPPTERHGPCFVDNMCTCLAL